MWLMTPTSFLSVVAHREKPKHVLVRARVPGDIQRVFPRAAVLKTPGGDYLYRATVTRLQFERALVRQARAIDYTNVKGAIPKSEEPRHHAMMRTWGAWNDLQRELEGEQTGYTLERDLEDQEQMRAFEGDFQPGFGP